MLGRLLLREVSEALVELVFVINKEKQENHKEERQRHKDIRHVKDRKMDKFRINHIHHIAVEHGTG